jgi:predicted secreted Zn-dependent protease
MNFPSKMVHSTTPGMTDWPKYFQEARSHQRVTKGMLVIQSLRSKNQMEAGSTVNDDCQRNKESETRKEGQGLLS